MRSSSRPRPSSLARLVGRAAELAQLERAARSSRLVAVVGPAGAGKSRLVAEWLRARPKGGEGALDADVRVDGPADQDTETPVVDLAGVRTREEVVRAVAAAVAIPLVAARSTEDAERTLLEALAERRGLLVLDDVEGARGPLGELATSWLEAGPELVVLVTSRVRLDVDGEALVPVGPLGLAPAGADAPSDAVALLVERGRAYRPELDAADPDVRGLAEELEGLPLALELAAARLVVLAPKELRARVRQKTLDTLSRGKGAADSLAKRLAWSLELLGDAERRALVRLAVFAPDFTVEDAERALDDDGIDLVVRLREHHLLREVRPGRFAPWEGLRELVLGTAPRDEVEAARRHHARDLAARVDAVLDVVGVDGAEAVALVRGEATNLRAALDHALDDRALPGALVATLFVAVARLAWLDGPSDALARADARLADDPRLAPADRARVVHDAATLAIVQAPAAVRARLDATLGALPDDVPGAIRAPLELARANALMFLGEVDAALASVARAEALAGDHPILGARAAFVRAALVGSTGAVDDALGAARDALRRAEEARDCLTAARAAVSLVTTELELGRLRDARRTIERARAHATAIGDHAGLAYVALSEASATSLEGDVARAARELEASAAHLGRSRYRALEAHARLRLGLAELELGDLGAAEDAVEHAFAIFEQLGQASQAATALAARALVRRALGDEERAREDAAAATERAARFGRAVPQVHALVASLEGRAAAGDDARTYEARVAQRLGALTPRAPAAAPPTVLWLSDDGFALGDAEKTRLDHKPRLLGLARALCEASADGDGFASRAALIASAWPNERILEQAAANRLNVALSSLRKLGLPLETGPRGVRLKARVRRA